MEVVFLHVDLVTMFMFDRYRIRTLTMDSLTAGLLQLASEAWSSAGSYLAGRRGPTAESLK